jgi:hypothetical protein
MLPFLKFRWQFTRLLYTAAMRTAGWILGGQFQCRTSGGHSISCRVYALSCKGSSYRISPPPVCSALTGSRFAYGGTELFATFMDKNESCRDRYVPIFRIQSDSSSHENVCCLLFLYFFLSVILNSLFCMDHIVPCIRIIGD